MFTLRPLLLHLSTPRDQKPVAVRENFQPDCKTPANCWYFSRPLLFQTILVCRVVSLQIFIGQVNPILEKGKKKLVCAVVITPLPSHVLVSSSLNLFKQNILKKMFRPSSPVWVPVRPRQRACSLSTYNVLKDAEKRAVYTSFDHTPTVFNTGEVVFNQDAFHVLCIPVYSIMLAVNMTKIDLFILADEDAELDILETIPFNIVNIAVFMIEADRKSEEENREIHKFLDSKKYTFYDRFSDGIYRRTDIFIKQKYLKTNYDWRKLLRLTLKDTYKILTGSIDDEISDNEIELLEMLF
ncbi:hypothetical protein QYM36_019635 [Artemia franciscana]|uniref:Uncharacterized protein n=1 Tax=Artemia franciscana TaxID=6661 RepID=A0AA88H7L3_ARTSF|nr:hypothetical protein QYM36_019635 [Artemia franciscana]